MSSKRSCDDRLDRFAWGGNFDSTGFINDATRPAHDAEDLRDGEPRLQSVFVEASAEIGPAKPSRATPLQRPEFFLRGDRCDVEDRMVKCPSLNDEILTRRLIRIERDETRRALGDSLQSIHPIGHRNRRASIAGAAKVVPARPDRATARH